MHIYRSVIQLLTVVFVLLISTGCILQQQPLSTAVSNLDSTPSGEQSSSSNQEDWTTFTDSTGEYTIPVSHKWIVNTLGAGMIAFQDPKADAGGEDATIVGGVDILARNPGPNEYISILPNHGDPLGEQTITTAVGLARVFTLRRDADDHIWYEQHAYLPVGNRFYDVWFKGGSQYSSDLVAPLARMLDGFRLVGK